MEIENLMLKVRQVVVAKVETVYSGKILFVPVSGKFRLSKFRCQAKKCYVLIRTASTIAELFTTTLTVIIHAVVEELIQFCFVRSEKRK